MSRSRLKYYLRRRAAGLKQSRNRQSLVFHVHVWGCEPHLLTAHPVNRHCSARFVCYLPLDRQLR